MTRNNPQPANVGKDYRLTKHPTTLNTIDDSKCSYTDRQDTAQNTITMVSVNGTAFVKKDNISWCPPPVHTWCRLAEGVWHDLKTPPVLSPEAVFQLVVHGDQGGKTLRLKDMKYSEIMLDKAIAQGLFYSSMSGSSSPYS
jgi:hypothetical protein